MATIDPKQSFGVGNRMRVAWTALLILVCAPAWAEWVLVSRSETSESYADPASIEVLSSVWGMRFSRIGNRVIKVEQLLNFKTAQRADGFWIRSSGSNADWNRVFYSAKSSVKYDCDANEFQLLRMDLYTGQMGGGTNEATYWWTTSARASASAKNKATWEAITQGSKEADVFRLVCRKM